MIPIKLTITGFLSYHDTVELDFTLFDLACISGPNGAGKSSLLDAFTWALFGQARRRDESLINLHSTVAEVSLVFEYETNTYKVQRTLPKGKTTSLEFQIREPSNGKWKALTGATLRNTQELIEHTLRLDYETFVNASFFLQGKADQFTQQKPNDRKRILGSILGLEVWETYRQRVNERRKSVEIDITGLDGRTAEINAELSEEAVRIERLETLQSDLKHLAKACKAQERLLEQARKVDATLAEQRKLVNMLGRQLESVRQRQSEFENRLVTRKQERENHTVIVSKAAEIETRYASWLAQRAELERWDEVATRFREHEAKRQAPRMEIETERARLTQEMEQLQLTQSQLQIQDGSLVELESQISIAQQGLDKAEQAISRRAALDADLQTARQKQADARAENPRLKAEMDQLKARIDQLSQTEGAACPLCGRSLETHDRLQLIEEIATQGREMGDRYRANQAFLKEADQKVSELETQIESLSKAESERLNLTQTIARLTEQIKSIQQKKVDWEGKGARRLTEVQKILNSETYAKEARLLLGSIDNELKAIGYDAAAHDACRKLELEARTAEGEFRALESARAALQPLDREITETQSQYESLHIEITQLQQEYDNSCANQAAAEAQAPNLEAVEREYNALLEQENSRRLEVGAAQQKVLVLKDLKIRLKDLTAQREDLARLVGQYKQLERAFGKDGVPALLIEQALPEIKSRANNLLDRLSEGNMSVRFVTQAQFKDKKREDLKETLDILISDGAGTRDYELYSGGEAFRVNFAIRLALSELLAKRAGARLQTLVIDEGFGSQDAMGRQHLIEAINQVKQDFAKVIVITHIDELKGGLSQSYRSGEDRTWQPGKGGISLPVLIVLSTMALGLGLYITWLVHGSSSLEIMVEAEPDQHMYHPAGEPPMISVIIPARNEARNIKRCVQALLLQTYPNIEVIVVDDRSSDETLNILEQLAEKDARLRIVHGTELPPGWAGKPHALVQGVAGAQGTWLCFMDADTFAEPGLISSTYRVALKQGADMFSILTEQELGSFWEKTILPLVFLGLSFGFPAKQVNDPEKPDAIANGQFILIRRFVYDQVGGHTAVKDRIDEDKAIATITKHAGYRLVLADGRKVAHTRMYTSLPEMWEGWTKNIYLGLQDRLWLLLFGAILGLVVSILLPIWLFGGLSWLASGGGVAAAVITVEASILWIYLIYKRLQACRAFRIAGGYALTFPLGALLFTAMMGTSAFNVISGRGVSWKGRQYR